MADNKDNNQQPKTITREEAEKMQDYAQSLGDKITHVVDYGGLGADDKQEKK